MPKNIKNILAVRNDRFGEFLLNIPALRSLKETFTGSRLVLVVSPYVKELAQGIPFVDEVLTWEAGRHSLGEKLSFIRELTRRKIDLAVILNPTRQFHIFTFLAGIPIRVGYDRKLGYLLNRKIKDRKYLAEKHEVEYNLELTAAAGAYTSDKTLSLGVQDVLADNLMREFGLSAGDILVALHPWTSDPVKQWPLESFLALAKRLAEFGGLKVVIVGGQEEEGRSRKLFGSQGKGLVDLTGKTTLKELAALLKKCRLLISGDSGPVHLASCVGTPVIALFRNDLPGKTAKRWGPWGSGNSVIEAEGLDRITVDEVFNRLREASGI